MNYGLQNRTLSHVEARYQISSWYSARRYQRKKTAHQSLNTLPRLTSEYLACIAGILIEVDVGGTSIRLSRVSEVHIIKWEIQVHKSLPLVVAFYRK